MDKISGLTVRSGITGAMTGVASQLAGQTGAVEIMGYDIPTPILFAVMGASASALQTANRDWLLPMVLPENASANTISYVAQPALTGLSLSALDASLNLILYGEFDLNHSLTIFAIGAGADLMAGYATPALTDQLDNMF